MGETIKELTGIWQEFAGRQSGAKGSERFVLNLEGEKVERLARGVLSNERLHGLKYCPCRMTTGNREEDLKLICPCNFKIQKTWKEKGECWCSLFVKAARQ